MAGLDSFYASDAVGSTEQGSFSSLSTPGDRSSMRHRRMVDPFHSSTPALFDEYDGSVTEMASRNRAPLLKKVGMALVF